MSLLSPVCKGVEERMMTVYKKKIRLGPTTTFYTSLGDNSIDKIIHSNYYDDDIAVIECFKDGIKKN